MKKAFRVAHGGGGKRVEHVFAFYNKFAFTLAEVLVTLGIIGVVSAMTIPTLMNQTNGKELQAGFKEAYSILSQAVVSVQNESMPGMRKFYATQTSSGDYPNANEILQKIYSKLKIVGKCEYKSPVRTYNKKIENPMIDRGKAEPDKALANGMCFNAYVNALQINLSIDVNGTKGPNVLGHDIFFFEIDDNDTLQPKHSEDVWTDEEIEDMYGDDPYNAYGAQAGDPCSVKSNQTGNGLGCAYWAMIDKNPDDNSKGYWESLP